MDKKSTPAKHPLPILTAGVSSDASPSRLTLAIIRQFARAYNTDRCLDSRLGGIVVN